MDLCPSEFKYPKFHMAEHVAENVRFWGAPLVTSAERTENAHKSLAKSPFKRAPRNRMDLLLHYMAKRCILHFVT